jgi:multidrug efflux pump subunit AcrA (membrane-fusion protein)
MNLHAFVARNRFPRPPLYIVAPLLLALVIVVGMRTHVGGDAGEGEPLLCRVYREPFLHELPIKGELESERNTEVRCEVRSRFGSWVRILDVVDEGTYVRQGDFLVRLDSSQLETERTQHLIVLERAQSLVVQTRTAYESAMVAREEYLNGEYALQRQTLDRALQLAKHREKTARNYLEASRKLLAGGYITGQQLEADQHALVAAETDANFAETRLRILDKLTRPKRLADLDSAVAVGKVKLESAEFTLKTHRETLAEIDEQIGKCTILAPVAGEVVLAHLHHEGHSHMVMAGEETIQNRVLIRLPDPSRMQVRVKLREDTVAMIRAGMSARMRFEAFPDVELAGAVIKVNEYPEAPQWFAPSIKEYAAVIGIDTPMAGMRPGLTADLKICVDQLPDAIQISSQAILARGKRNYCIVYDGHGFEARLVTLGPTNGRAVVIEDGLQEGERVVLRPGNYVDRVELP